MTYVCTISRRQAARLPQHVGGPKWTAKFQRVLAVLLVVSGTAACRAPNCDRPARELKLTRVDELPGSPLELGGIGAGPSFLAVGVCARSFDPQTLRLRESPHPSAGSILLYELNRHDGELGSPVRTIPLRGQVGGITWDGRGLLTVAYDHGLIYRCEVDGTRLPTPLFPTPSPGVWGGFAFDGTDLWLHGTSDPNREHTAQAPHMIYRLNRSTGQVLSAIPSDAATQGITWCNGTLVASVNYADGKTERRSALQVLDAETGAVVETHRLPADLAPSDITSLPDGTLLIEMQVGSDLERPFVLYRGEFIAAPHRLTRQ